MALGSNGVIHLNQANLPTGNHKVTIRAQDRAGNWSDPITEYAKVYNLFTFKLVTRKHAHPQPHPPTIARVVKTIIETIADLLRRLFG